VTKEETRPIIQIRDLVKVYDILPVLRQINLEVPQGQFVALLGPNGSGKSTLLRLIAGLSKPTTGDIIIGGWRIPQEAHAVRAQIGMVSHKSLLYENLTARENLLFLARLYNLNALEIDQRVAQLLEQVGLRKRSNDLVRTFSRGMQQRLSIARALLHEPHVLLFDEPYTGLDQDAAGILDTLLAQAHQNQHTIIMSTHQLHRIAQLADRIVILSRGKIAHDEPAINSDLSELARIYTKSTGSATPT